MFDELDCLRESPELQRLLGHYAEAGAADRDAWQDRLMESEGVEARELGGCTGCSSPSAGSSRTPATPRRAGRGQCPVATGSPPSGSGP
jgi:hypothetical protein